MADASIPPNTKIKTGIGAGRITHAHVVFWLGLPVMWALPTVYYNVNIDGARLNIEVFTVLHMFIIWFCCYVATRAVAYVARGRSIKPILIFLLGAILGILLLARPLLRLSVALRADWFSETEDVARQILDAMPNYLEFSPEFLVALLSLYWFRIVCWAVSAWFFYSFFGKPSFGLDTSRFEPLDRAITTKPNVTEELPSNTTPQFFSKVNPKIGQSLIALKAEGHYVRVYTRLGNDLIYYRFSDAVSQLGNKIGTQVHRSYWVNAKAATAVKDTSGKFELLLPNDLKIPIGQTYKQNVRALGLIP